MYKRGSSPGKIVWVKKKKTIYLYIMDDIDAFSWKMIAYYTVKDGEREGDCKW